MTKSSFKIEHEFGKSLMSIFCYKNLLIIWLYLGVLAQLIRIVSTEKRRAEAERIRGKYPDRFPVRTELLVFFSMFLVPILF